MSLFLLLFMARFYCTDETQAIVGMTKTIYIRLKLLWNLARSAACMPNQIFRCKNRMDSEIISVEENVKPFLN